VSIVVLAASCISHTEERETVAKMYSVIFNPIS